jgi:hypothetical protein
MIRPCTDAAFDTIYAIINEAAEAYRGVIPADRWHEPYTSEINNFEDHHRDARRQLNFV